MFQVLGEPVFQVLGEPVFQVLGEPMFQLPAQALGLADWRRRPRPLLTVTPEFKFPLARMSVTPGPDAPLVTPIVDPTLSLA